MSERARARMPWVLFGIAMLLLAGTLAFSLVNGSFSTDAWFIPLAVMMILGYSTVGALLASRNPTNPIGWLMMGIGGAFVVVGLCDEFLTYTYVTDPGALGGGTVAAWLTTWIFAAMFALLPFLGLLFPNGRVPGPRWRFLVPITIAFGVVTVVGSILAPGLVADAPEGVHVLNPTGVHVPGVEALTGIGWLGLLGALIASIGALVVRFRRSVGDERQQIRWLAYVAITTSVVVLAGSATAVVVGERFGNSALGATYALIGFALAGIGVPVAMGVAILKYRLYDLDLVIRKAVVFGILVLLLTAVFLVGALAIGGAFAGTQLVDWYLAMIIVAFAIGVLIAPLWRLSRRIADRVVYGGRANPYEVLTEFSGRMAESYSTEDVLPRMAQILGEGTGADSARVWLNVGGTLRPEAAWPSKVQGRRPVSIQSDELPAIAGESVVEVRDHGELLGALSVTMPASDPMNASKDRLVRDLASQAGLVLRNVRLIEELRASRRRLVAAQDLERRRLERNIHDGAQQQLVALAVKLRLADQMVERDQAKAREILEQLQSETNEALEDLRDLARGIYPPLLADKGLPAAIDAQARKSALPVTLAPNGVGRYPQDVEATVYFCVLEALQNVAKYAEASNVTIEVAEANGRLTFEVRDDGVGFDPATASHGTGLQGMADRVEAIGGAFEIRSSPGNGTTVSGLVPITISGGAT